MTLLSDGEAYTYSLEDEVERLQAALDAALGRVVKLNATIAELRAELSTELGKDKRVIDRLMLAQYQIIEGTVEPALEAQNAIDAVRAIDDAG